MEASLFFCFWWFLNHLGCMLQKSHFWYFLLVCGYFGLVTSGILLLLVLAMKIRPLFFQRRWLGGMEGNFDQYCCGHADRYWQYVVSCRYF